MRLCHVLREDTDLAAAVSPAHRDAAVAECVAATMRLSRGRWGGDGEAMIDDGIGLLVLDGLIVRRVGVGRRFGSEILGEGDLLRPWQGDPGGSSLPSATGWRVLAPTRLALLDAAAERRFAAYPQLTGRLVARALERSRNLSINMAIVGQARVKIRLELLFWHLADRWGRVRSDGVLVPLALTHAVLADLVAARRPTVTAALTELARQGIVSGGRQGWLLEGEPPAQLSALGAVGAGAREAHGAPEASGAPSQRRRGPRADLADDDLRVHPAHHVPG